MKLKPEVSKAYARIQLMSDTAVELAAPDTLLGMLQRGRGAGYLLALKSDYMEVHKALMHCLMYNPKWDRQIEDREEYYAEIMLRTSMDVTCVGEYLSGLMEEDSGWIAINTLGEMAKRGHLLALAVLRNQVESGTQWDDALFILSDLLEQKKLLSLAEIICQRFSVEDILQRLDSYDFDIEPWNTWKETHPHIREAYEKLGRRHKRHTNAEPHESMSTSELLGIAPSGSWRIIGQILSARKSAEDTALLEQALGSTSERVVATALRALGRQHNPVAIPLAVSIIRSRTRAAHRHAAYDYMESLPARYTLRDARGWFSSRSWRMRVAGERILKQHAQLKDVPMLRVALSIAHSDPKHQMYREGSILESLARLPKGAPYPEAITSFIETPYSLTRWRAAKVLAASDQDFPTTFAVECLWDCYWSIQEIGCRYVDLSIPGVGKRLLELAHDHEIAKARLRRK
ncbi:MAG: hypothetical protein FJ320_05255 [SAR202 cluster bacterium]|nr:hypothetical protein [SAR202 cluster bacterium]